jgi:transcriptional regulator with XRE-family HTH domain
LLEFEKARFVEAVLLSETDLRRRLSVNVRSLRNAAGLTLKVVSERAQMHWRHWQKIEAGQVNATLQTLVRIADALSVDPVVLLQAPKERADHRNA